MRDFIDIVDHSALSPMEIFKAMSPIARYRLLDRLPYIALDKGGWEARYRQAAEYIAQHMDEFS